MSSGPHDSDNEQSEDDLWGDHDWHFKYNRRLSCFSHAVTSLTFSQDGKYFVSGIGSGDVKVWDTGSWAEAAKLKGVRREETRALVISPAQRWLVSAYASVLYIFNCQPPWRLEQAMPAQVDPMTGETSEWYCIAFSPMAEVNHPQGHTGQDNHLAAFSSKHLSVLDYSGGWNGETPKRTRSLLNSARPSNLVYTADGWWLICGFESGDLQVWNAFSLTLERTLAAHSGHINGLTASPRYAEYDSRFVSCGIDQTLRVWHSCGWILEQIVPDTRCDRNGVLCVTFSATGAWLVSVAVDVCVWRVCITRSSQLVLRLHQRLSSICGAEGLRTAAFCSYGDAIAVGSQDGVLGLWTKYLGLPPDPPQVTAAESQPARRPSSGSITTYRMTATPLRPMQRVTADGVKPLGLGRRSLSVASFAVPRGVVAPQSPCSSAGRQLMAKSKEVMSSVRPKGEEESDSGVTVRTIKNPDLKRWRSQGALEDKGAVAARRSTALQDALNSMNLDPAQRCTPPRSSESLRSLEATDQCISPQREALLRACRGNVRKITLDPHVIGDGPADP